MIITHVAIQLIILFICNTLAFSFEISQTSIERYKNKLLNYERIKSLYKMLDYQPIWDEKRIEELKFLIEKSKFEGLNSDAYKVIIYSNNIERELKLTDNLIKLAYHTYYGIVNPSKVFERWDFPKKEDKVITILSDLIKQDRLRELFEILSPKYENYKILKEHLKKYYELADKEDGSRIELKEKLKIRDVHPSIQKVRKRLYLLGYLNSLTESTLYDEKLEQAIKKFQETHNLEADGILGKETLRALNMSIQERILQIRVNLEKYRWLPENLGDRYILINIPSFELNLYSTGKLLLQSRIVVGKNYKNDFRPTPLLYSTIKQIIINPDWYVPYKIAIKDILPRIKKNPEYLIKDKIKVYLNGEEQDPMKIDWSSIDETNFPFKLIQKAGKNNALGKIKFYMPNNFDVYLHDTPHRHLFSHKRRTFSSGCIRIEKALQLAQILIENNTLKDWNEKKLNEALKSQETIHIILKQPVPVYILYFTNFVKGSDLYFLEDIYDYDKIIAKHLRMRY